MFNKMPYPLTIEYNSLAKKLSKTHISILSKMQTTITIIFISFFNIG